MNRPAAYSLPKDRNQLLIRLLETIEDDIMPMTARGVEVGNKVFGAALLRKSDLSLVLAETNNEQANPLWHGEMHCLKCFYECEDRPPTDELLFLSTHEPCSLCLSAITWAGFDNFFYLFSHAESRDDFAIPHDLGILKEVFGLHDGRYNRDNAYWSCFGIMQEIDQLADKDRRPLARRVARIGQAYDNLSAIYQASKDSSAIPLR